MKHRRLPVNGVRVWRQVATLKILSLFWGLSFAQVLPPPSPATREVDGWEREAQLFVRHFRFEGNRAFSDGDLAKVTSPFENRTINTDELEQVRRAITLFYVGKGYVSSGAVIPDQDAADGIITIRVVEGSVSHIELEGNRWLSDGYVRSRLERWSGPPVNLNELQDGLQQLRQNPNVQQVNAELKPGVMPGQSRLEVRLKERQPFRLGLQFDNQRPPSVGAEEIWLLASDLNLTGHSDPLEFRYGIANSSPDGLELSGADNLEGSYQLPLTRYDTTLRVHGSRLNTTLIEEPFPDLDINSLTLGYSVDLRQPVYRTANEEVALAISFEHRENQTWLLGEPFSLSPGAEDGRMDVPALRLSQEWLRRSQNSVVALRSTFSLGLDVLGATDSDALDSPDAQFFAWLGQVQYVQRLFRTQSQLVLRVAGQWTAEPLLALEQFSVGGLDSVRGYLENQLIRDRGLVASMEFRLALLHNKAGAAVLFLAPFFDFGGGWNVEGSPSPTTISSAGAGLVLSPERRLSAQLYWGYRLRDVEVANDAGLQGAGVSFKVHVWAF